MVENGVNLELLLAGNYGHRLHVFDLNRRRYCKVLDLGPEQQMLLSSRRRTTPRRRTVLWAW